MQLFHSVMVGGVGWGGAAGVLSELTPAEAVALLSALVFQERTDAESSPGALPQALEHAASLAKQAPPCETSCLVMCLDPRSPFQVPVY